MCGGKYGGWKTPRQLTKINGEPIVARTIRLLKQAGIKDIAISANQEGFDNLGVEILHHENDFGVSNKSYWLDAFYPTDEEVCYLFGDVVFSKQAIDTIINVETDDIQFFASAPPFAPEYPKRWAEPFAFKVVNQKHFRDAIEDTKMYFNCGLLRRNPIAWELWQVIKQTELNVIDYTNYVVINDKTCDIDKEGDIEWQSI
jgi:hypothetical protein